MGEPQADRPLDAPGRGSMWGKVAGVLAWPSRLVLAGLRVGAQGGAARGRGQGRKDGRGLQRSRPGPCTVRLDGCSEAGVRGPGCTQPAGAPHRPVGPSSVCREGHSLPEPTFRPPRRYVLCP